MWQKHGKLVAADAKGPIRTSQRCDQEVAESAQGAIATSMPRPVVDRLELVKVNEEKCQRHAVTLRRLDLAIKLLVERSMITEPG